MLHGGARAPATTRCSTATLTTLSGGEQKRLVLEYLLAGPDEVLLLDEPDNFLDVPGKRWLEGRMSECRRRSCSSATTGSCWPTRRRGSSTVELGAAGNTVWTHPGGFASYHEARRRRFERFEELGRRWDEEHAKLRALVLRYKIKAEYNDGLAAQYQAAQTRLREVRGRRAAAGDRRASSRSRCGSPAAAPASGRWSARAWS